MVGKDVLVSVVIPVYNCEDYIEECISSIKAQTYQNIEPVIIDDGSTDRTYAICEALAASDDRIVLLKQENKGVVSARQRAIENAHGKYIAFVDGDDRIAPDMIQIMADGIGNADMISAGMTWEERKGLNIKRRDLYPPGVYSGRELEKIFENMIYDVTTGMSHSLTCWMCNKMFLTEKAAKIHAGMDPELKIFEDASFVYRYMLECEKIVLLDAYPYHYRYNTESAWHKMDTKAIEKIGRTFAFLSDALSKAPSRYGLKEQLQYWLFEKTYFTLNERMEIPSDCRMIRFLLDAEGLEDKKLVIYGAGRCGQDVRFQLGMLPVKVVLWVDRRYEECRMEGLDVAAPEDIKDEEYDLILVAVENQPLAERISGDLSKMGIEQDKIKIAKVTRAF